MGGEVGRCGKRREMGGKEERRADTKGDGWLVEGWLSFGSTPVCYVSSMGSKISLKIQNRRHKQRSGRHS
jgi:hypothetical protein